MHENSSTTESAIFFPVESMSSYDDNDVLRTEPWKAFASFRTGAEEHIMIPMS